MKEHRRCSIIVGNKTSNQADPRRGSIKKYAVKKVAHPLPSLSPEDSQESDDNQRRGEYIH